MLRKKISKAEVCDKFVHDALNCLAVFIRELCVEGKRLTNHVLRFSDLRLNICGWQ